MAEGNASPPRASEQSDFGFLYSPTVGHVEEVVAEQETGTTGRKRVRNPDKWTKKHVKRPGLRKNSPRLQISDLSETDCCRKKCLQQFSPSHLSKVRDEFESMYYEEQNIYLNGILKRRETKKTRGHARKANPTISAKGNRVGRPPAEDSCFTYEYFIRNEKGVDIKVCQTAFCSVYGFGPKRLLILRKKQGRDGASLEPDRRGKHDKHVAVDESLKDLIREHIRSFPVRHSHYSRQDNRGRVYLSPELSIAKLHRMFLEAHDPEYIQIQEDNVQRRIAHQPVEKLRKPLVSEHLYHDIFVSEFNIHFGYPRSDTCDVCDSLKLQMEQASESEKAALQKKHEDHLALAKCGYDTLCYDQNLSKESWEAQMQHSSDPNN